MPRIEPSWEKARKADIHSPQGVRELREEAKAALMRKYTGLAQGMFRWEFDDSFSDMTVMSQGEAPEKYLWLNGSACVFELEGQHHILPWTMNTGLNLYGMPASWHAVPVSTAYGAAYTQGGNALFDRIIGTPLDQESSVIIRNDLLSGTDKAFVSKMVDMLVDNILTENQLQLIARAPVVFNVSEDNLLSAKNYFKSVSDCRPVIFTNSNGEGIDPVVPLNGKIDPSVFELFDRVECLILDQLGYPCTPITKRAQQSVSEVESNGDKLKARRDEKLRQREIACDRMKEVFGATVSVESVVDAYAEEQLDKQEEINEGQEDDAAEN